MGPTQQGGHPTVEGMDRSVEVRIPIPRPSSKSCKDSESVGRQ
jgi:hypothetical protein